MWAVWPCELLSAVEMGYSGSEPRDTVLQRWLEQSRGVGSSLISSYHCSSPQQQNSKGPIHFGGTIGHNCEFNHLQHDFIFLSDLASLQGVSTFMALLALCCDVRGQMPPKYSREKVGTSR